jgi:hypothetical protein
MSEKQMFFSFLAFALCFAVIMVAISRVIGMRSSAVAVEGETNSRKQFDSDTFRAPEDQPFPRNRVKRPETKRTLAVKTRDVKLDKTTPPVENSKPKQATDWEPLGIVPGYSARRLQDGRTEFRDFDGNVYLVGTDECFTLVGGKPHVLKSGVRYSRSRHTVRKNGFAIEVDQEYAEWVGEQYMLLSLAWDDAPDEETRARIILQAQALVEEYGTVSGSSSSFMVSNNPLD